MLTVCGLNKYKGECSCVVNFILQTLSIHIYVNSKSSAKNMSLERLYTATIFSRYGLLGYWY